MTNFQASVTLGVCGILYFNFECIHMIFLKIFENESEVIEMYLITFLQVIESN
jgi:hypothetical protein